MAGAPDAPLVVCVHGSMDRGAAFARVAGALRDVHVVRYDRRGYGRSVGFGSPGIDGHSDDLLALLDGQAATVFGHSLGGDVALAAAAERPDLIRSVLVYEAPMSWLPWWPSGSAGGDALRLGVDDASEAAERFVRRMVGDARWEAMGDAVREQRRAEGAALVAELTDMRDRPPYRLRALIAAETPVVVAHGTESAAHQWQGAATLAWALGIEPRVIEGAGHGAHLSHPSAIAALVREAVALACDHE